MDAMRVEFTIPGPVPSCANLREHWHARAKRAKAQRGGASLMAMAHLRKTGWPPNVKGLTITLTRLGPRKLDSDNLASSCKAHRDGIADALGIDDGDARLEWVYQQERGAAPGLRVTIESKVPA